ncbi:unnamed protein product, partial [Adineta steineri]
TNVANILIFSYGRLRTNICSWYFICLSISQILSLFFNGLYRIIVNGWNNGYDYSQISMDLCKFRGYGFVLSVVLSRHFLCLILLDRWMITSRSASLRNKSSLKVGRWKNLRNRGRAIHPSTRATQQTLNHLLIRQSRSDFQLIRLSLIQILFFIIFNAIYSTYYLYFTTTISQVRTGDRLPIELFVTNIGQCLLVTYAAVTFALYMLASSVFRQEFQECCMLSIDMFCDHYSLVSSSLTSQQLNTCISYYLNDSHQPWYTSLATLLPMLIGVFIMFRNIRRTVYDTLSVPVFLAVTGIFLFRIKKYIETIATDIQANNSTKEEYLKQIAYNHVIIGVLLILLLILQILAEKQAKVPKKKTM